MKIEFRGLYLETLLELQSSVPATVSSSGSSAASKDNTIIMLLHQPVGQPPHSVASSAMDVPGPCALPVPPIPPIQHPPAWFLHWWKRHSTGKPITDQQLLSYYFGNSASKKRGDSNVCCTNESFWTLFMHIKKHRVEKSGSATNKCCKNVEDHPT